MTRRQKKKRSKRKWLDGCRPALLRTVPNRWKVSWADKINEVYEDEVNKRLDEMILYGTQKRPPVGIPISGAPMQAFVQDSR
jgi:hypothetical protein